jgi:methionine synthase I (cobalamin-dependent)/5,10-methylenetetrahydrofolate reductase
MNHMPADHPFLARLRQGPILGDGGMGTQLYARGISFERSFEQLNLTEPELVKTIHLEYAAAGAEMIETNTFGANRYRLAEHGLERNVRELNRAGAKIAREARELAERPIYLAGSMGPLGSPLAPLGDIGASDARAAFREQAEALLETGVDLLLLETISDLAEMREALSAVRSICTVPIVACMTFGEDGTVMGGEEPAAVARTMRELGADVVGVNCALGPASTLEVIEGMRRGLTDADLLAVQPNAGLPRRVGSRFIYISTPKYFADYTHRFLHAGVCLLGGCCGTTPRHIAAMSKALREFTPHLNVQTIPAQAPQAHVIVTETEPEIAELGATPQRSTYLAHLLAEGHFVVSAEMLPPRSVKSTQFLHNAEYVRERGVDVMNITDNAMARVRMSNIAAARLIQQHVGVETIVHFTPRDRNLMAVQSDLIGAHATGIRTILAVTGDPPAHGDFPNATGIWDVDSIGLIAILSNLNRGLDGMGRHLGTPTSFYIGCAATPSAPDGDLDLERLHRKINAGAQFIMTQPVYDAASFLDYFDRYTRRYGPVPVPIIVGLQPLHSAQQAEKFHHEVPGIVIPEEVRTRLRLAGEAASQVGVEIIKEVFDALYASVQGAYIMTLGRYDLVGELLPHIHLRAQAKK